MARLSGRFVKIVSVTETTVTVIHIRNASRSPHPDSCYSVPYKNDPRKRVDYIKLTRARAEKAGLVKKG